MCNKILWRLLMVLSGLGLSVACTHVAQAPSDATSTDKTTAITSPAPEQSIISDNPTIYVISGGPGSGKTTILNALKDKGYLCFDEAARRIIQDQTALQGTGLPWVDLHQFNTFVLDRMLEKIDTKNTFFKEKVAFFDRGIPDIIAYLRNDNRDVATVFINASKQVRYNKVVFLTPPWKEIYKNDKERKETFEMATAIYEHLKKAYLEMGYLVYDIPTGDIKKRVQFVIDTIEKQKKASSASLSQVSSKN